MMTVEMVRKINNMSCKDSRVKAVLSLPFNDFYLYCAWTAQCFMGSLGVLQNGYVDELVDEIIRDGYCSSQHLDVWESYRIENGLELDR